MNKNMLVLAYLGDSVFELYVRNYLIEKFAKVNTLQKEAIKIATGIAKSQKSELLIHGKNGRIQGQDRRQNIFLAFSGKIC